MIRSMGLVIIAWIFMAVPVYGIQYKIATLSPEGSVWMQKMQAGADEIQRKTSNRVRFKFFGGILLILAVSLATTNLLIDADVPAKLLDLMRVHVQSKTAFLILLNVMLLAVGAILDIYSAALPFMIVLLAALMVITYVPGLTLLFRS